MPTRTLRLRAERLTELTADELGLVVAAGTLWDCGVVPTTECTGDHLTRSCW